MRKSARQVPIDCFTPWFAWKVETILFVSEDSLRDRLAMPFHHLLDEPGDHLVEFKEVPEEEKLPPNKDRTIRQNVDYTEGTL